MRRLTVTLLDLLLYLLPRAHQYRRGSI
ncbi:hypothetical protein KP509_09G056600 [Ceratopteris richardii]|uniref:Uncharacterized protein n=1 Tax=Ceratopteris richardii TaxID=49495 RepID=A0A8T2U2S0_CERRI|nr:hypothetical protein KP509_09G056600 [Ceratopteris richardii]